MKKFVMFALVAVALFEFCTVAGACGDKFLVLGKGLRYERAHAAAHPGSILIYRNKSAEDPKAGADLEKALRKAGHKIQTVHDVSSLDGTLKTTKYDVVMVNLSDASLLEEQIVQSPYKPAVLPIIYNTTGTELEAAGKQYECVLKAAGKNSNILKVVDEVVGERQKGIPVKCQWSK